MEQCPICGDFDIGDWCNHCNVPTKEVPSSSLTKEEWREAEEYYSRLYQEYVESLRQEYIEEQCGHTTEEKEK